jgi:hypothetical protein
VGPRTGLDVCEKSRPHRDSITVPSSPLSVALQTELPGLHTGLFHTELMLWLVRFCIRKCHTFLIMLRETPFCMSAITDVGLRTM